MPPDIQEFVNACLRKHGREHRAMFPEYCRRAACIWSHWVYLPDVDFGALIRIYDNWLRDFCNHAISKKDSLELSLSAIMWAAFDEENIRKKYEQKC